MKICKEIVKRGGGGLGGGGFIFDEHNTKIFIFVEFCVNTHESAATMPGKFKN